MNMNYILNVILHFQKIQMCFVHILYTFFTVVLKFFDMSINSDITLNNCMAYKFKNNYYRTESFKNTYSDYLKQYKFFVVVVVVVVSIPS